MMLNWFKKSDPIKELQKQYQKLMEESYQLSHTNRKLSDLKAAEAEEVMKKLEALKASGAQ